MSGLQFFHWSTARRYTSTALCVWQWVEDRFGSKSAALDVDHALPVYPNKRTFSEPRLTSQKGQYATSSGWAILMTRRTISTKVQLAPRWIANGARAAGSS